MFLSSLDKEWQLKKGLIDKTPIQSIYFGGGTPSKLSIEELQSIFSLFSSLKLDENCEITIEVNPEDVTKEYLIELKALKINRLSIGVQSFDDSLLQNLKRTHSANQAKEALYLAKKIGFENISIDLMYDLPHQNLSTFKKTLSHLKDLPITHLSLYNLVFEKGSLFYAQQDKVTPHLPKENESLKMLEQAVSSLEEIGLFRYEISAFAKNDLISIHNTGYWTARPFLGFGPSAFSYWDKARIKNVANLKKYTEMLEKGHLPIEFTEKLDPESRQKELFAVELRLFNGVNQGLFEKKEGPFSPSLKKSIEQLLENRLIQNKSNTFFLTERGRLFYDTVGEMLV